MKYLLGIDFGGGASKATLLCENGKNYYYVGFICDKGLKKAYLIDGVTGEVIAEKDN